MKVHVHVYRVNGMEELDVDSETKEKGMQAALLAIQKYPPESIHLPDCKFIAVVSEVKKA